MGDMLWHVLPPLALGFTAALIGDRINEASRLREIEALKGAPRRTPKAAVEALPEADGTLALRLALLSAAVALIVLGVMNGGARDVLIKAINLCTECIGLG